MVKTSNLKEGGWDFVGIFDENTKPYRREVEMVIHYKGVCWHSIPTIIPLDASCRVPINDVLLRLMVQATRPDEGRRVV